MERPTKDTIIERIVNNSTYANDDERAADVQSMLIGGHDTTAYTVAWILKELAKDLKEQQKLRDSLNATNVENWEKSGMLRKIVKEGMRLHPVVAGGSVRTIGKDMTTNEGYFLPKGTIAFIPYILLHRNTDIYEDADSFVPSRWDEPTKELNEAFMPFAAGKQNCVGQSLANAEIHSIVPQICSQFELEIADEGHTEYFLTLKPIKTMIKAKRV